MGGVGKARAAAEAGHSAHNAVGTQYTRQAHRAVWWESEALYPI